MNQKHIILLLSIIILPGFAGLSHAQGWYVGGGLQKVSFEDDLAVVDGASGFSAGGGYGFNEMFSMDLMSNGSIQDDSTFNGYVVHWSFLGGGKLSFGTDRFRPYLAAGISFHVVDFEFFEEITGSGTYWGVGADIFLAKQHALNISFRSSDWNGKDPVFDYDITTEFVTVAYNFYFSR